MNLAKYKKQIQETEDPKVRVYSRLLKYFSDEFVLN